MNPNRGKVDISNLTPEQRKDPMQIKYGQLGGQKAKGKGKLLLPERKYFDSGDYAMSKAGKSDDAVGLKHPSPESIPHQQLAATQAPPPLAGSSSSISSGGLPIVSGIGISVGAAGTMANPSGLSPPAAHHISEVGDDTASNPPTGLSPPGVSGNLPHLGRTASVDSSSLGHAPAPGAAPAVRPAIVRRISQTPSGMQYRVKD
ncbi:hypothetical protein H4S04_000079 [Coemansia sp. S16]|nr:hypothetical protein LPJ71_001185 [Coemansia sp. S17]KAJ2041813.1 hypothetical protein H4S03_000102 [Coemansia sp. S3946]KAJ2054323.1 hypothetical protein H4S04_000079 [Coemansia sp. S16]